MYPLPAINNSHPTEREPLDAVRRLALEMAGRKLPGERDLARRFGLSRPRLRSVLAILEAEGVLERRQGSGTYARDANAPAVFQVGLLVDARLKLGNDPFFSRLVEKVQLCLQAAGIRCVIERIDGEEQPRFLGDGIITIGLAGIDVLSRLRLEDPPGVSLLAGGREETSPVFSGRVSLLLEDDMGAGAAGARRLLAQGCRRLVFFGREDLPASRARREGVRQAVAVAAATGVTLETVECAMNYGAGRAKGLEVAPRFGTTPSEVADIGLIAANDWLAVGLRSGLAAAGSPLWSCPLVSFDGLPIAADPALAIYSLVFPAETVAEDALAELRRLARYPQARSGRVIRYSMEWADGWTE